MADAPRERVFSIQVIFVAVALLFMWKAFDLQIWDSTYRNRAEATAIDKHVIYPSRGLIYDRNGKLLVNNNPVYDLMVTARRIDPAMDTLKFCKLLGITNAEFLDGLDKDFRSARYSRSVPFVFRDKISPEIYARFRENLHEFPGFYTQLRNNRSYPQPYAAHLLGYIREVDQKTVDKNPATYRPGDYIGAVGLERQYEKLLRGNKGVEYLMKDNLGRSVGAYQGGRKDSAAVSGIDLMTSIDLDAQGYAEELMRGKKGAVVAIDPRNGEVLVFVSSPSYDPNSLAIGRGRGTNFNRLLADSTQPFFNRATVAAYPPGSIFKTAMGLAAMQEGIISPQTGFRCSMGYRVGSRTYACHGHEYPRNMGVALAHSCNSYFWNTYRMMVDDYNRKDPEQGLTLLNKYLKILKFGQPTGIDFPNESSGNFPTPADYDKVYPKRLGGWKSSMTMSTAIGQGEIQMTTVQMASLAATIAARGTYYKPHIVRELVREGQPLDTTLAATPEKLPFDEKYLDHLVEGMAGSVNYGTAPRARISSFQFCGKTGTSQNSHGEDHSVFFGFGPREQPTIAIAVFIENAGFGGTWAAPLASLIVEKYVNGTVEERRLREEKRVKEMSFIETLP
ncbi:MAG: penicillin-binding protein 2 [Saprospiraceae bacterium]